MEQKIDTNFIRSRTDAELDTVSGGSLLHFVKAIVYGGSSTSAGGSGTETDSNLATHTQVWVISAS